MPCTAALPALGRFTLQNTFSYPWAEAPDNILKLPWTSRFNISITLSLVFPICLFIYYHFCHFCLCWLDYECHVISFVAFPNWVYFILKLSGTICFSLLSFLFIQNIPNIENAVIYNKWLAKAENCMLLGDCVMHIITYWALGVNIGFSDGLNTAYETLKGS